MSIEISLNVMSVELAIRRELAYRDKVLREQFYADPAFMENLLPLEIPSPDRSQSQNSTPRPSPQPMSISNGNSSQVQAPCSSTSCRPSPEPNYNIRSDPFQLPYSHLSSMSLPEANCSPSTRPSPCEGQTSDPPHHRLPKLDPTPLPGQIPCRKPSVSVGPTYLGMKRKSTSPPPLQPKPLLSDCISVDQYGIFICKICEVPCSGASCLQQHLKGHKHKAKLKSLQTRKIRGEEKEGPKISCDLCHISCTSETLLQMHFKGQKHLAKLGSSGKTQVDLPWCEVCDIWCMNKAALEQHFKGQKHSAKLREFELGHKRKRDDAIDQSWHRQCKL